MIEHESTEGRNGPMPSRRRFLIGTGVVATAGLIAACGGDDDDAAGSAPSTADDTTSTTGGGGGDAAVAKTAAGLEVLAVGTYQAAAEAAGAGKLGQVPPAVGEFVKTALAHHQEYVKTWNGVLMSAGEPEVTEPPAELKATVDEEFGKVKDVAGAAKLALMLEQIAAATYTQAIPAIEDDDARTTAAAIDVITRQRIAVLHFALGEYPVPETFASTDQAVA
jgi:hypothetical protein